MMANCAIDRDNDQRERDACVPYGQVGVHGTPNLLLPPLLGAANEPRMLTPEEQEQLRQDLKDMMELLKQLREEENRASKGADG